MTFPFREDLSKEGQLARSPGGNRKCPTSGELKASCKCRPCIGRRARGKGKRKQNEAKKAVERAFNQVAAPTTATSGQEEYWRLALRLEVKAGTQARTVDTFYRNTKGQSDQSKAIGDLRPFGAIAMPDGSSDGFLVIALSSLPVLAQALRGEL